MPDPLNPVKAEFGELGEVAPIKPEQKIEDSDAFKKEMEKKSRSVNEKERGEQKDEQQLQHEVIVEKPIIQEDRAQNELSSILDVQKPTSSKQPTSTHNAEHTPAPKKTVIATSSSDTSADLSQGDDDLASKLPKLPTHQDKTVKTEVFVQKNVAPPPLTTPLKEATGLTPAHTEKKAAAPIQMTSSSGHGDTSSKQKEKPAFQESPHLTEKQAEPFKEKVLEKEQTPLVTPKPHSPSLLDSKTPAKPLIETHAEPHKLSAPQNAPLLPQEAPPETKKHIEAPASTSEMGSSLEKKQEMPESPAASTPQEKPTPSPLDLSIEDSTSSLGSPFEMPLTPETRKDEIKISKKEEEERAEGRTTIRAPSESDSLEQEKHDQEEKERGHNVLDQAFPTPPPPLSAEGVPSPFQEAVGFDRLPPHILDLFDRIIGVITVLQVQGKSETTIHLNEKQSPLLQGTEITITTFDTARLSYNIELKGSPQAVTLFQKNVDELKRSFKDPKKQFNFQIHEIMISLKDDEKK